MDPVTNGILSLPRLYILSEFHPKAVKHAQSLFDCVLHTSPEAAHWRKNAAAILVKNYTITAEDLQAAPQLRVIGKQGVGLDLIDMKACEAHGVKVFNTPGVNATAVAEMALCLALSVSRDVPNIIIRQKVHGETVRKETITGQLIMGKTVGVIGMGNIGRETARIFQGGLRTPIITYDPHFPEDSGPGWAKIAHRRVHGLEELLKESDIVSVHVPLTPSTKGLISYDRIKLMKPSAILLNTARGGIVDEDDLTRALEERVIAGAGFDCHEKEPPPKDRYERLWACPGFVGTPHIAAATEATQVATTNGATDQVYAYLKNEALRVKA
ncbi:hypothetical protein NCS57_01459700 [Fusarium keratoplasticum]|uniref:Uncharacterized protein n=1 Tax=Fusarium keratoplasticum TaxID=1328300 RepID=A0ACC0QCV8_9HYPO|nr:hypothetical protein NCS57_01459700 [Fusarium keratoplasticum]KAI8649233.1 hypothetical protein NCS57_01459700 [Fusarium keratoplasticum]KAI8649624.1 hypothetical protein NCS55_01462700 [Fusarium keratoplasticum]